MSLKTASLLFLAILSIAGNAFAGEAPPALALSKAAKLAEDAIISASLPDDCFLRAITLIEKSGEAPYYRVSYKPTVKRERNVDEVLGAVTLEVIRVTMDGKVSFVEEEVNSRHRIRAFK